MNRNKNGQLRIIGGEWRGRKLPIAGVEGLRPTGDRVRETLFNWLMHDVHGSRCLDLFSGSGALALEALSRGAREVTLIEKHPSAAQQLKQNLQVLDCSRAIVIETDALNFLQRQPDEPYNLVFLDPPFQQDLWQAAIDGLSGAGWLSNEALIYVETPSDKPLLAPPCWHLHKEKRTGDICYRLYIVQN